ncbi:MAG: hypothetical protein LBT83_09645 [Tannerella sp.]|jgi:hypothetical protein|nr:hypothetical protein [Tannerella sp.]
MKNNLVGMAFLCICLGTAGCKNDEPEVELEPVMTLYDKPLSTIQNSILGKWKWYVSYGGIVGISYPENTFVEFTDNHCIVTNDNGQTVAFGAPSPNKLFPYSWKELKVLDYRFPNKGLRHIMWDNEQDMGIWYFEEIHNETLFVGSYSMPFDYAFIRVK